MPGFVVDRLMALDMDQPCSVRLELLPFMGLPILLRS